MNATGAVDSDTGHDDRSASCQVCGHSDCREQVPSAGCCSCGADVVVDYWYAPQHDAHDAARLCAHSRTLTRDGWDALVLDALVEQSLAVSYGSDPALGQLENQLEQLVDAFFDRWMKSLTDSRDRDVVDGPSA
jgi:hypothetical protein